jgi:hypothetical protein
MLCVFLTISFSNPNSDEVGTFGPNCRNGFGHRKEFNVVNDYLFVDANAFTRVK